jgi:hypothetical protein
MKWWQQKAVNVFFWLFKALIEAVLNNESRVDTYYDKAEEELKELNGKRPDDN